MPNHVVKPHSELADIDLSRALWDARHAAYYLNLGERYVKMLMRKQRIRSRIVAGERMTTRDNADEYVRSLSWSE